MIEIDFSSGEAFYLQLRNQIIYGIATKEYGIGDILPSVRQMADVIGINMHTVSKAYGMLSDEGLVRIERGRGAIIAVDFDKLAAIEELRQSLYVILARGAIKGISRGEAHQLIDEIYNQF